MKRGGAALAVMVLLGGGSVWLWQRSAGHRMSEICGGMLPVDDTLAMVHGSDDLELEDRHISASTGSPELSRRCKANNIWVTIEPASGSERPFGPVTFKRRIDALPVPIGSGWTGFVARGNGSDSGALLLECENWARGTGEGLLVTVRDSDGAAQDPANRTDLARVLTGTARRAAERAGCDAAPGSDVRAMPPLPPETDRPTAEATGTCRGTTSRPSGHETAAGRSPAEYCVLRDGLVLSAMYGPYAEEEDEPAGVGASSMWGSATCKGVLGTARYRAWPQDETRVFTSRGEGESHLLEPPTDAELADLTRFAQASAARHGCGRPELPRDARPGR